MIREPAFPAIGRLDRWRDGAAVTEWQGRPGHRLNVEGDGQARVSSGAPAKGTVPCQNRTETAPAGGFRAREMLGRQRGPAMRMPGSPKAIQPARSVSSPSAGGSRYSRRRTASPPDGSGSRGSRAVAAAPTTCRGCGSCRGCAAAAHPCPAQRFEMAADRTIYGLYEGADGRIVRSASGPGWSACPGAGSDRADAPAWCAGDAGSSPDRADMAGRSGQPAGVSRRQARTICAWSLSAGSRGPPPGRSALVRRASARADRRDCAQAGAARLPGQPRPGPRRVGHRRASTVAPCRPARAARALGVRERRVSASRPGATSAAASCNSTSSRLCRERLAQLGVGHADFTHIAVQAGLGHAQRRYSGIAGQQGIDVGAGTREVAVAHPRCLGGVDVRSQVVGRRFDRPAKASASSPCSCASWARAGEPQLRQVDAAVLQRARRRAACASRAASTSARTRFRNTATALSGASQRAALRRDPASSWRPQAASVRANSAWASGTWGNRSTSRLAQCRRLAQAAAARNSQASARHSAGSAGSCRRPRAGP